MRSAKKYPIIVQSNKLVEARYTLTVGEQRLILAMVSMIHPDDADFFDYEIGMKELSELLNIDMKNIYREADKIIDRLMERVLHIPKPDGYLIKAHWVAMAEYKKGSVMLTFAPKLKPYLLNLKREFTKCDLAVATQFKSIYSIRIYQLLKQYKGIGYREFRVDELKEILGIKPNEYREFKRFRSRVINQAKKEFGKKDESGQFKCDLTFSLETFREGRRIARMKFIIIEQEYHQAPAIVPVTDKEREQETKPPEGVRDRLIYYGISAKQADGFIEQVGEDDIQDVLTYYADLLKAGKVKNTRGAYLAKLLRDGVAGKSSYKKDKETAEELRKKQRELEKQQQELARQRAEEERRLKNLELEQRFDGLPEEDQEKLLSEFEDSLERFMLRYFYKDGVRSVVIRGHFLEFLEKRFGGEESPDRK
jgi:plasmid replication initiation protein